MKVPKWLRRFGLAAVGVVTLEVAARIVFPGINAQVLREFFQNGGGNALLRLYELLGGGALSSGGALALGIMPYLSARVFMRIGKSAVPAFGRLANTESGQTRLTRITRALTVGLAVIQSYGFAKFVQSIPGAVTDPGVGFTAQTILVLTGGAVAAMVLAEHIAKTFTSADDDEVLVAQADAPSAQQLASNWVGANDSKASSAPNAQPTLLLPDASAIPAAEVRVPDAVRVP